MNKIYIDVKGQKTLRDFILECVNTDKEYELKKFKATYYDKNLSTQQCKKARRSFEDILIIVKTNYRSNVTKKTLAKTLYNLWKDNLLACLFCKDIEKLVFFGYTTGQSYNKYYRLCWDDYLPPFMDFKDHDISYKGNSEYSLQDILDLAGFKDRYKVDE